MLCGFGQYVATDVAMVSINRSLVAAILVLQIRDFLASFLPSDDSLIPDE